MPNVACISSLIMSGDKAKKLVKGGSGKDLCWLSRTADGSLLSYAG